MKISAVGVSASPRKRGNTKAMLLEAFRGAESAGDRAEYLALPISPCK